MSQQPKLSAPEILIENLDFTYKSSSASVVVLKSLSAHFMSGSFNVILGKSGCGKSTLLRLLAGLYQPDNGQIIIDGRRPEKPSLDRSLIFQKTQLFPWMSLKRNVCFVLKSVNPKQNRKARRERALQLLKMVCLEDAVGLYPYQLSGGMAQRAAFAMTLAQGASLWLMDEPFAALDPDAREETRNLLLNIWDNGRSGRTVVFVTHDIEEALQVGQKLYYMREGELSLAYDLTNLGFEERAFLKPDVYEWFITGGDCVTT